MIVSVTDPELGPVRMQGMIAKLGETPGAIETVGPKLGEHTSEVLRDVLGMDAEAIAALARDDS